MDKTYFMEAYRASDGLCGQHLLKALQRSRSKAVSETLIAHWADKLRALLEELEKFLRKLDYRYATSLKAKSRLLGSGLWRRSQASKRLLVALLLLLR
jgi:hypothetical protein